VGDSDLADHLVDLVSSHDIDPTKLVFELTETAAVANIETAREFADRLGRLGCRFALDDFGAGFGSFYYLKHLPFDFVKIDGEFVERSPVNFTDRLILSSIVDICRGLGKKTIAEFVASPDIQPLVLQVTAEQAFTRALTAVRDLGWNVVSDDREAGRIEAVDTTFWFGFKDDVVIRVREVSAGSARIDVRSKSRVGVSDLGSNARRVRALLERLQHAP